MKKHDLKPDCARCASLCCVAFAFNSLDSFAIDKKAGEPCPKLSSCGGCSIYDDRERLGFRGCVGFNCYGAGQRVTQEFFHGQTWKEDSRILEPMVRLFIAINRAHEVLQLLREVQAFDLPPEKLQQATGFEVALETKAQTEQEFLRLESEAKAFLRSLRPHVSQKT
jgi:hypothetical protein